MSSNIYAAHAKLAADREVRYCLRVRPKSNAVLLAGVVMLAWELYYMGSLLYDPYMSSRSDGDFRAFTSLLWTGLLLTAPTLLAAITLVATAKLKSMPHTAIVLFAIVMVGVPLANTVWALRSESMRELMPFIWWVRVACQVLVGVAMLVLVSVKVTQTSELVLKAATLIAALIHWGLMYGPSCHLATMGGRCSGSSSGCPWRRLCSRCPLSSHLVDSNSWKNRWSIL